MIPCRTHLLALLLGFCRISVAQQVGDIAFSCPDGWYRIDASCYKIFPSDQDVQPWSTAQHICESYGSHLVKIEDFEQYMHIVEYAKANQVEEFHIGFNRHMLSDTINPLDAWWNRQMESRASLFEGYWANNQPDIKAGNCAFIRKTGRAEKNEYRWNFCECEVKRNFICQRAACPAGTSRCANGWCVRSDTLCDDNNDCGDYSDEINCASKCRFLKTDTTGTISSPGYPSVNYQSNTDCTWTIVGQPGTTVHLNFSFFDTEEHTDMVQILVGGKTDTMSSSLVRLSGQIPTSEYLSVNNFMIVKFYSDSEVQKRGFSANYQLLGKSDPTTKLTASDTLQFLQPPLYSINNRMMSYLSFQDYVYILQSETPRNIITLERLQLDLKGEDYVNIRDGSYGSDVILASYTADDEGLRFVYSTRDRMYIYMKTMSMETGTGFKFSYKQGCNVVLTDVKGTVMSPGYGATRYANFTTCTWTIDVPNSQPILMRFEDDWELEDNYDMLQIFKGTDDTGEAVHALERGFTSSTLTAVIASATGEFFIRWTTDAIINKKGFKATYSINCPNPNFNSFTNVVGGSQQWHYGNTIYVQCSSGYKFASQEFFDELTRQPLPTVTMQCNYGGEWSTPRIPQCEPVYCGPPAHLSNGYVETNGVVFNSVAMYHCYPGFTIIGNANASCTASATWQTEPSCQVATCINPGSIASGQVDILQGDGTSYGSIISYSCNEGHDLIGAPRINCLSNSQWSDNKPTCERFYCPRPVITHGTLSPSNTPRYNEVLTITCNTGYKLDGASEIRCLGDQTMGTVPNCINRDECTDGQNPCDHGNRCVNTEGSYYCTCDDGYLLGTDGRTCTSINECQVNNGGCGELCTELLTGYTCSCPNPGYTLFTAEGTSHYSIPVGESGLRYRDVYHIDHTCVRYECSEAPNIDNAILMTKRRYHRFGDYIKYFCNLGYVLQSGTGSLKCGASGQWSGPFPSCVQATCPEDIVGTLQNPATVSPVGAVPYLATVTLTCNVPGKTLFNRTRQCLYNKANNNYRLFGDRYECGFIDCGQPEPKHGSNYGALTNTQYGASFTFGCINLYSLNGEGSQGPADFTVRCESNGQWNFNTLHCLGVTCTDPGTPADGNQLAVSYAEGSEVTFECDKAGFKPNKPYGIKCILNVAGNALVWNDTVLPTCTDQQNPVITNCLTEIKLPKYSLLAENLVQPIMTDQVGYTYSLNPPRANLSTYVVLQPETLTYTVRDYEGNQASCDVPVFVRDVTPPTITCPSPRTETLRKVADVIDLQFGDTDATYNDNVVGGGRVSANPTEMHITAADLDRTFTVTYTAFDAENNMASCTTEIMVTAALCSPLSLSAPVNGTKLCDETASGFKCSLSCNPGHTFHSFPGQQILEKECITGFAWPDDPIPACSSETLTALYTQVFEYEYIPPSGQISSGCISGYKDDIQSKLPNLASLLTTFCQTIQPPITISISFAKITYIFNNQWFVSYTLEFSSTPEGSANFPVCGAIIQSIIAVRADISSLPIKSLFSPAFGCQTITGQLNDQMQIAEGWTCQSDLTLTQNHYCLRCPAGTFSQGFGICTLCPVGEFSSSEGATSCTGCPAATSTYRRGSTSINDCISQCQGGTFSASGMPPCRQCPLHTYWFGSTTCQDCPTDTITTGTGKTSLTDCKPKCVAGSRSYNGYQDNCQPCPQNFFNTQSGMTECFECPDSQMTDGVGATGCIGATSTFNSRCLDGQGVDRCGNGATCSIDNHDFFCDCPTGYYGPECLGSVNYCASNPCFNDGACIPTNGGFSCSCLGGTGGLTCEIDEVNNCDANPCRNGGACMDLLTTFKCLCPEGYAGFDCNDVVSICSPSQHPCQNGGECFPLENNVARTCSCLDGYTGIDCETNIDECASNPCLYGGGCLDGVNSYQCQCPSGYGGPRCQQRGSPCSGSQCSSATGQCVDDYTEDDNICVCNPGYDYGEVCQYDYRGKLRLINIADAVETTTVSSISECRQACEDRSAGCAWLLYDTANNRCDLMETHESLDDTDVTSSSSSRFFVRNCIRPEDDYWTFWHDVQSPAFDGGDDERLSTHRAIGLNICGNTEPLEAECRVKGSVNNGGTMTLPCGTQGLQCTNNNAVNGQCDDYEVRYKCCVARVFANNVCNQKDYCAEDACERGTCQPQFEGYTCDCPPGWEGSKCQHNIDACNIPGNVCQNSGKCVDLEDAGLFFCECPTGYEGDLCQTNTFDCDPNPCDQQGAFTCVDLVNDYSCQCRDGYMGKNCSVNIQECNSNPCFHDGICADGIDDFTCSCKSGWFGKRCENEVDLCSPVSPCQSGAVCSNIFNDYYCSCPEEVFGKNCQNQADFCRDAQPCLHNGHCEDNQGTVSCDCPVDYTGNGCHIKVDHCAQDDTCLNDGTCNPVESGGFYCQCQTGFSGTNCELNEDDCAGVQCANNADCIDGLGTYYCRCPVGKTGVQCDRDLDLDYDLCFESTMKTGRAALPYPLAISSSAGISISLWVRFMRDGGTGTFFSLFEVPPSGMRDSKLQIELAESTLIVNYKGQQHKVSKIYFDMNDGQWHNVVVNWDATSGVVDLILDSISHGKIRDVHDANTRFEKSFWIVLGSKFDPETGQDIVNEGFQGCLSQVTVYNRPLHFVNEIPGFLTEPRKTYNGAILMWGENVLHHGVRLVRPSTAKKGDVIAPSGMSVPFTNNCPGDKYVYGPTRLTSVIWIEPDFQGMTQVSVRSNYRPGETFLWGSYLITYEAQDTAGNKAFCHFRVHVAAHACTSYPPDPYDGTQTCQRANVQSAFYGCQIACESDAKEIVRYHPNWFTCGMAGSWNPMNRYYPRRYPPCGPKGNLAKKKVIMKLHYRIATVNCDGARSALIREIQKAVKAIHDSWGMAVCGRPDCSDVIITVTCGPIGRRRRKRQTSNSETTVDVTIPEAERIIQNINPFEDRNVEDVFYRAVLERQAFDFSQVIPNGYLDTDEFTVTYENVCESPYTAIFDQCVLCGPGTYYEETTTWCEDCAVGMYQSNDGQTSCEPCPGGQTTLTTGSSSSQQCHTSCQVGHYFDEPEDRCKPCKVGFYQDEVGQFMCKPCGVGETTRDEASGTSTLCYDDCLSGFELSETGDCRPCQIGYYRTSGLHTKCTPCDPGWITPGNESKSELDCDVVECLAGSMRVVDNSTCQECPVGTYQDQKWQTDCKPCGSPAYRYRTDRPGSTTFDQCKFFCDSGYQADGTNCQICPYSSYRHNELHGYYSICQPCPDNYRTLNPGAFRTEECNIYRCEAGHKSNAANNGCDPCLKGWYQEQPDQTVCDQCGTDLSTRDTAATLETDCESYCPSGQEKDMTTGACMVCPIGYYKDNSVDLFMNCTKCPRFFTTAGDESTSEAACSIRDCDAGSKIMSDDSGCELCPRGTYQPERQKRECISCDPNYYTRETGSTHLTQCETFCPSGEEKVGSGCQTCLQGNYKDNNEDVFSECTLCPIDFITSGIRAVSLAACNIRNCSAGSKRDVNTNQCDDCPLGEYQPEKWKTVCETCPVDTTTELRGATDISDCKLKCLPGKEDIEGECKPCQIGFYKPEYEAKRCTQCDVGWRTLEEGSTQSSQCNIVGCSVGYYRVTAINECQRCPYDQYQDLVWQDSCKACGLNRVTLTIGATSMEQCVPHCQSGYEYNTVTTQCDRCPRGYYRDSTDRNQPSCVMCPAGKITMSDGATSLAECSLADCRTAGTYRNPGTNACEACPIGTWQNQVWQDACIPCNPGYSTRQTGSSTSLSCELSCEAGKELDNGGQCVPCATGYYKVPAAWACVQCTNGLITRGPGEGRSAADCTISPCGPGEYFNLGQNFRECQPCARNQYQPSSGSFSCLDCADGKATTGTGSRSSDDCKSNCDVPTLNTCSPFATCTSRTDGVSCTCNEDAGYAGNGETCTHLCERNYCLNTESGSSCVVGSVSNPATCVCDEYHQGDRCQFQKDSRAYSTGQNELIIGCVIGALIFCIIVIILVVCCARSMRQKEKRRGSIDNGNDFDDKRSVVTRMSTMPYDHYMSSMKRSRSPSPSPWMPEIYDNSMYRTGDPAVYQA